MLSKVSLLWTGGSNVSRCCEIFVSLFTSHPCSHSCLLSCTESHLAHVLPSSQPWTRRHLPFFSCFPPLWSPFLSVIPSYKFWLPRQPRITFLASSVQGDCCCQFGYHLPALWLGKCPRQETGAHLVFSQESQPCLASSLMPENSCLIYFVQLYVSLGQKDV